MSDRPGDTADADGLSALFDRYRLSLPGVSGVSISELSAYSNLESHLGLLSQRLAREAPLRQEFAASGSLISLLECVDSYFTVFQEAQNARPSNKDTDQQETGPLVNAKEQPQDPYQRACQIATLCFRIIRNAMAACSDAQNLVCQHFHLVSPFLDSITRFHTLNDPDATLLARSAAQMLSNLVTTNQNVQRRMWPRLVIIDGTSDGLVLKLLSSPDTSTQSATQILLINFLRTPSWPSDAHQRCFDLCTTASGLKIIQSLLSTSDSIMLRTSSASHDESEYEPESEIEGLEESLGFVYTIFAILFERGYSSLLLSALAPMEEIPSSSEADLPVISSSQLTLMKLLDSWLHVQQKQVAQGSSSSVNDESVLDLAPVGRDGRVWEAMKGAGLSGLTDGFMHLSRFARSAMASGIAQPGQSADDQPQDRRLIGVHNGLLLLLQCLLSISMTADGWSDEQSSSHDFASGTQSFASLARAMLSDMRRDEALVDELVALLDQTHRYAPALSPFRPADGATSSHQDTDRPLPEGHALSSTGKAAHSSANQPSYGFDHLKRDLVRILGSLVYTPNAATPSNTGDGGALAMTKKQIRQVQDRIREKGGLFHVLNMTVLDERNPYMREHAIFALRYLLAGNTQSQALIDSLQPSRSDTPR